MEHSKQLNPARATNAGTESHFANRPPDCSAACPEEGCVNPAMKSEPLDWSQQRVFVTGASGFVGSWLVKALLQKKAAVTVLIRDLDDHSELVRSGAIGKVS